MTIMSGNFKNVLYFDHIAVQELRQVNILISKKDGESNQNIERRDVASPYKFNDSMFLRRKIMAIEIKFNYLIF